MPRFDFAISFPCSTGMYEAPTGVFSAVVDCRGKRCLSLFADPQLVEQFFKANLGDEFVSTSLSVFSFKHLSELIDYLDKHWHGLVAQGVFHLVTDANRSDVRIPRPISRLLYKMDIDRFLERLRHRPYCDWSEVPESDWNFLPLLPTDSVIDVGSFLLRPDGSVRLPEGREITEHVDGCFYLTDDDDKDFLEILTSKGTVLAWGGALDVRNDRVQLEFVFTARDKSRWDYKYVAAEQTWYERKKRPEPGT